MRVTAAQWLPVPVLDLRRGDVIGTVHGIGRVRGWTWLPGRGQVRVGVTLLATRARHVETFSDEGFALRRSAG